MICAMVLLSMQMLGTTVHAADEGSIVYENDLDNDPVVTATYLIYSNELTASNTSGKLCINGNTICNYTMKTVAMNNIVVERSSNGSTGWAVVNELGNVTSSNTSTCYITNMQVSVSSGYYYRVTCDHYAKETGWFPKTQSISNTSNTVYIP